MGGKSPPGRRRVQNEDLARESRIPDCSRRSLQISRADGQYRWFAVSGAPLKAGDGRVLRWYGVLIDIDDRRKAEEALRESEYKRMLGFAAQLQATLNVIPAYAWYAAPSGGLTFVNKRTADFLGAPNDHPLRFGI